MSVIQADGKPRGTIKHLSSWDPESNSSHLALGASFEIIVHFRWTLWSSHAQWTEYNLFNKTPDPVWCLSHSALDSCVFLLFPAWSSIHFLSWVLLSFSICLSLTSPYIVLPLHIAAEPSPEILRAQLVVASWAL